MIRLNKNQLVEITQVLVFANTPLSLLKGFERSSALQLLRVKCSKEELVEYYDYISARPRRSAIVVALAYAVLIAILFKARDGDRISIDASRLLWGEQIKEHMSRVTVSTSKLYISQDIPSPRAHAENSASADTESCLFGPNGQPLDLEG